MAGKLEQAAGVAGGVERASRARFFILSSSSTARRRSRRRRLDNSRRRRRRRQLAGNSLTWQAVAAEAGGGGDSREEWRSQEAIRALSIGLYHVRRRSDRSQDLRDRNNI